MAPASFVCDGYRQFQTEAMVRRAGFNDAPLRLVSPIQSISARAASTMVGLTLPSQ
jgi:hypothetical protein